MGSTGAAISASPGSKRAADNIIRLRSRRQGGSRLQRIDRRIAQMADRKRKINDDMFARTAPDQGQQEPEPGDNADLDEGRIISSGVGVSEGEMAAIDTLIEQAG